MKLSIALAMLCALILDARYLLVTIEEENVSSIERTEFNLKGIQGRSNIQQNKKGPEQHPAGKYKLR